MSHGFGRHVVCGITLPLAIRCLVGARVGGAGLLLRDAPLALLPRSIHLAPVLHDLFAEHKGQDRLAREVAPCLPLSAKNLLNLRLVFLENRVAHSFRRKRSTIRHISGGKARHQHFVLMLSVCTSKSLSDLISGREHLHPKLEGFFRFALWLLALLNLGTKLRKLALHTRPVLCFLPGDFPIIGTLASRAGFYFIRLFAFADLFAGLIHNAGIILKVNERIINLFGFRGIWVTIRRHAHALYSPVLNCVNGDGAGLFPEGSSQQSTLDLRAPE